MAEDNYVAAINAARQRTRGDLRRRIDQIIDPMESAAQMDRLQGTSVMPTTGQVDPGAGNIMRFASGGGAAPVRTAVGGGSAPIQTTAGRRGGPIARLLNAGAPATADSPCAGGNCGTGVGTTATTNYPMLPAQTTVPPTISADNSDQPITGLGLIRAAIRQGDAATSARQNGTARVSSMHDRAADRVFEAGQVVAELEQREREFNEQQFVNREQAKHKAAENALTYAQTGVTRNSDPVARIEARAATAQKVFEGKISHNAYADLVVQQHAAAPGFSDEGKGRKRSVDARPAVSDGRSGAQVRAEALREIHTGSIMYGLMNANPGMKQLADTPSADFNSLDLSKQVGDTIGLSGAAAGIARSYHENGAFKGSRSQVEQQLRSDLNLLGGAASSYFEDERRNDADFAGLSPARQAEELADAGRRGLATANAIFRLTNDKMQAWWGQAQRGEFNEADPDSPRRSGSSFWPSMNFLTPKPVDSNTTLPPPIEARPE